MRSTTCLFLAIALTATTVASAQSSDARKAPHYSAQTVDGKTVSLDAYQGRVILLAFVNTECPHCQKTSQMMGRFQAAYGDTNVQAVAVAVNANATKLVPYFIERTGVTFPVAIDSTANARKYLGIPSTGAILPPVVVVIDRQGMIQAEYGGDDPIADDEAGMRALIDKLLAPGAGQASTKR